MNIALVALKVCDRPWPALDASAQFHSPSQEVPRARLLHTSPQKSFEHRPSADRASVAEHQRRASVRTESFPSRSTPAARTRVRDKRALEVSPKSLLVASFARIATLPAESCTVAHHGPFSQFSLTFEQGASTVILWGSQSVPVVRPIRQYRQPEDHRRESLRA